jgi:H+/Cl- antiporter ClcA
MTKESAEQSMMLIGFAFICLLGLVVFGIYLATVWWARDDARRRGVSPWLIVPLVALGVWPIGLLIWMKWRPKLSSDTEAVPES